MTIKEELIKLMDDALKLTTSDIHFVLKEDQVLIQFRAGSLMLSHDYLTLARYRQLLSYIRFHSALDLSHPKQPQSGVLSIEVDGGESTLSARVSILPSSKFQSLVLRVINSKMGKDIEEIPFFAHNTKAIKRIADNKAGLLLIGGPTGSGKTTTVFAIIDYLKYELQKSIVTIEDPVEYQQEDIVQMQVNESSGMTYDVGIKEILRHDPDVIVIGEIRDPKTAQQAIRAALTGHLVISTVHSKDNIGTLHRLLDLGINLIDLRHSIVALLNQRLVEHGKDYKALFEVCTSDNLENVFNQVQRGAIEDIPFTTLDEEFLRWRSQTGQKSILP